jgi:hypothetical protein
MPSYPLQQNSKAGTIVKVPGSEIDPASFQRDLLPICEALSRLVRSCPPEMRTLEVALSITPSGDIAFLRSSGEDAAIKLTFERGF